jgi:hypothetical protein
MNSHTVHFEVDSFTLDRHKFVRPTLDELRNVLGVESRCYPQEPIAHKKNKWFKWRWDDIGGFAYGDSETSLEGFVIIYDEFDGDLIVGSTRRQPDEPSLAYQRRLRTTEEHLILSDHDACPEHGFHTTGLMSRHGEHGQGFMLEIDDNGCRIWFVFATRGQEAVTPPQSFSRPAPSPLAMKHDPAVPKLDERFFKCKECERCTESTLMRILRFPDRFAGKVLFSWNIGLFLSRCPRCGHWMFMHSKR